MSRCPAEFLRNSRILEEAQTRELTFIKYTVKLAEIL
jgi:hypothetical protein